ncbi:MAG TPA: hypothetical protein PLG23_05385 [Thermoflexales bacterium]|jgi:sulfide dehydrogenase cytochrome subunit|nr:hypothetical protein [Thermoflexales bacterium]HQX09537.1 hypothetical protein [Thermoflexales bacterium]HQY23465.1 hypothetical protein [Thermoflexales bacterium]HQZ52874.1 hypothetical protein [Thermoflexales bacterium]HRA52748.1 hypothetical protein [Thermoflexales bacterium]
MRHDPIHLNKTMAASLVVVGAFALLAGLRLSPVGAIAPSKRGTPSASESTATAYMPAVTTALQRTLQSSTASRLLASNCFQCHGTDGKSSSGIDRLAGMSASEIIDEMQSMRVEPIGNDIMKAHARGYTDAELLLIADYFSRQ